MSHFGIAGAGRVQLNDFVIASVGGQGGLLATRVLADVLSRAGDRVKTSEVHGMAQRGGSVMSFVRRGQGEFSPVIDPGTADALLGLELLETARALVFLRPGAVVVANAECVMPVPVITGQSQMPADLAGMIRKAAGRFVLVQASEIATGLGSSRVANVVCLGALAACSGIDEDLWRAALAAAVPPRTLELNLQAFAEGIAAAAACSDQA